MPTTKRRLNISLSSETDLMVRQLAKRDYVPEATKVSQLLEVALEIDEDAVWDAVAAKRDKKNAKFLSHKKAWE